MSLVPTISKARISKTGTNATAFLSLNRSAANGKRVAPRLAPSAIFVLRGVAWYDMVWCGMVW